MSNERTEKMMQTEKAAQPKAGRKRRWARFDLPVIRPSSTRNKIARRLV
jgi:adenylosuccinate synthase